MDEMQLTFADTTPEIKDWWVDALKDNKKDYSPVIVQRSPVDRPTWQEMGGMSRLLLFLGSTADEITPWSVNPLMRDKELREFWKAEPTLASTVYAVSARAAGFKWEIVASDPTKDKPVNTIAATTEMLHNANLGRGWESFVLETCQDLYTADNGAFISLIRAEDSPAAPVLCMEHLDSAKCLAGDTRVLFEDGSTISIKEIVKHKYGGYVMSIDEEGNLVPRRILSFYETDLNDRYWIRLRLANPKRAWGKSEQIQLTNDHEVLTLGGWKRADNLQTGDRIATDYRQPSENQMQLIVGTLLGDGYLTRLARKQGDGQLSSIHITHSEKQREWLQTKVDALKEFSFSAPQTSPKGIITTTSKRNPYFGFLRSKFYPEGKKIVPMDIVEQYFSPRMLSAWFLDDGNRQTGKWGRDKGHLYTMGFDKENNEHLCQLLNNHGIACLLKEQQKYRQREKTYGPYFSLYITADGMEVLTKLIAPYVPSCLRYKLPESIAKDYPYDPSLWDIKSEVYYDELLSTEITNNGQQTQAFCIDVEGTHNFVAAGMVVHNCFRTGDPAAPVIYTDRMGGQHVLKWYQVIALSEMPAADEEAYGTQICAVSRVLRAAQILRSIAIYKYEKVSGQFVRTVHFLSGVTEGEIEDGMAWAREQSMNSGARRYSQPVIIPGIDPSNPLSHVQIDLASLPDAFDEDSTFKWYIAQLALGFGVDYQELAPLPGGNLGSSQQSQILHMKTQGKGPALVMSLF